MNEKKMIARGKRIVIQQAPGMARLLLDDEEIDIQHNDGEKPFATQYLPHIYYDSLENLARALVHHRFPGGAR
jgi:hypothetical protein